MAQPNEGWGTAPKPPPIAGPPPPAVWQVPWAPPVAIVAPPIAGPPAPTVWQVPWTPPVAPAPTAPVTHSERGGTPTPAPAAVQQYNGQLPSYSNMFGDPYAAPAPTRASAPAPTPAPQYNGQAPSYANTFGNPYTYAPPPPMATPQYNGRRPSYANTFGNPYTNAAPARKSTKKYNGEMPSYSDIFGDPYADVPTRAPARQYNGQLPSYGNTFGDPYANAAPAPAAAPQYNGQPPSYANTFGNPYAGAAPEPAPQSNEQPRSFANLFSVPSAYAAEAPVQEPTPAAAPQYNGQRPSYANMFGDPYANAAPAAQAAGPQYNGQRPSYANMFGDPYANVTPAAQPAYAPDVHATYLPPPPNSPWQIGPPTLRSPTTYGRPQEYQGVQRKKYELPFDPQANYTPEEWQQINAANGTAQAPFRYPSSSDLGMRATTPGWMDAGASAPGVQSPALTALKPLVPVPPPAYYGHGGGGGAAPFAANLPDYYVKAFESVFGPMANYYTPERGGVLQAQNDFSSLGSSWNYTAKQPLTQDSVDRLFGAFGGIARGQTARGLTPTMSGLFNYVASMLAVPSQQQQNVSYLQTSEL